MLYLIFVPGLSVYGHFAALVLLCPVRLLPPRDAEPAGKGPISDINSGYIGVVTSDCTDSVYCDIFRSWQHTIQRTGHFSVGSIIPYAWTWTRWPSHGVADAAGRSSAANILIVLIVEGDGTECKTLLSFLRKEMEVVSIKVMVEDKVKVKDEVRVVGNPRMREKCRNVKIIHEHQHLEHEVARKELGKIADIEARRRATKICPNMPLQHYHLRGLLPV